MRINDLKDTKLTCYYDTKDQMRNHIYERSREAFKEGDTSRDNIRTQDQMEIRKKIMREKFINALGGLPDSSSPLNAQVTGVIQCNEFRIEKVIYESRPKTFVTANLYVPNDITSPRGAVLFVCGHHDAAKCADEYQIVCQYLACAGLVVLAQDPIGQGERSSYYEKSLNASTIEGGIIEHSYTGCQCLPLGESIARYFLHDAMRGIDYLSTRTEVDPKKIGVTGNSGGGMQTSMMMVCDPRIAASVPTTFLMNRETFMDSGLGQDAEQIWPGVTAFGFDHEDILLCMAPRPTLVLAVEYDFFPIEGTKRTVERCRKFWDIHGKRDCIEIFTDDVTHHYTSKMAKKAAEFFSLHLLDRDSNTPVFDGSIEEQFKTLDHSMLRCTKSGQTRVDYEEARFTNEENLDRLAALEHMRRTMSPEELRMRALSWLREKIAYNRKPCELSPRHYSSLLVEDFSVDMCFWWSQKGIFNHAYLFRHYRYSEKEIPVTIAVWDGGTEEIAEHIGWIRNTCLEGRAVIVLDVTGTAGMAPNNLNSFPYYDFHGTMYKLTTDLIFLNDSLAALRAYDVVRAIEMTGGWSGLKNEDLRLYGHGSFGLYALLAAAIDGRVKNIQVDAGINSMTEWVGARHYDYNNISAVILPGALQYFDLPDLKRWIGENARMR